MIQRRYDLLVIGGGPAGLAAALAAAERGVRDILVLERERELGGILPQCIHPGFGLQVFREELTGPEYADRYIRRLSEAGIPCMLDTMVLSLGADRTVRALNNRDGLCEFQARAVVLAMGCRERTRGALRIPGTRPAGILTAGTAQRFVNIEGYLPGEKAVILGSGDIGLIMARRLTLEGASVGMVCELMPEPGGLRRNVVQCLDDFQIPLKLEHTVARIHGTQRLEGVTVEDRRERRSFTVPCDTLLLSVGLIPENELSRQAGIRIDDRTGGPRVDDALQTSATGIFACGNVLHVHDLVDHVTLEGTQAGIRAAEWITGTRKAPSSAAVPLDPGRGVRYVVPHAITPGTEADLDISFRPERTMEGVRIVISGDGTPLHTAGQRWVRPAEMIRIRLPGSIPARAGAFSRIMVHIEEEGYPDA